MSEIESNNTRTSTTPFVLPPLSSSFGSYPNPLAMTDADRTRHCAPVVVFPETPQVMDFTQPSTTTRHLATEEERLNRARTLQQESTTTTSHYAIGRYDENRVNMYISDMFENLDNHIDGYAGRRTVHVGIDLSGPVGTPVYACCNGKVHSAGYNADLGDYGYVMVIEHVIPGRDDCKFYALYGHLDRAVEQWKQGDAVKGGQLLAGMGDIHENGGWFASHVHFQIATKPPTTHDMPGAVSLQDREQALFDYPDPRYVLGELY
jgi:murein DD-endopeptidase MepM/ murein hydrolase activator NlpD